MFIEHRAPVTSHLSDGIAGTESRMYMVHRWVEELRRTRPILLVGVQQLTDYAVSLGPREVEDRAGGYPHPLEEGVICIPLPTGAIADIDAEDYPLVRAHSWQQCRANDRVQTVHFYGGQRFSLRLHRVVMMLGGDDERVVDHRDHNPLNNRKANLRICTQQQNVFNQRLSSANTSGIKGVSQYGSRWRATVGLSGKDYVRSFDTKEEAGAWARAQREELHGEFACHG